LLLAIIVGVLNASIIWFAVAALAGEVVALGATIIRLNSKHSISPGITIKPALVAVVCVLSAWAIKWLLSVGSDSFFNWLLLPVMVLFTTGAFMLCFRELRVATTMIALNISERIGWPASKQVWHGPRVIPTLNDDIKD
jgi:hypothetical protein